MIISEVLAYPGGDVVLRFVSGPPALLEGGE